MIAACGTFKPSGCLGEQGSGAIVKGTRQADGGVRY